MDTVEAVLAHYGVKGMKWGVRRGVGTPTAAHPDAVKAKEYRDRAKKGSTDALGNDELQQLVQRLNLERQYKTLNLSSTAKGKRFAAEVLLGVGRQQATKALNDVATKKLASKLAGG